MIKPYIIILTFTLIFILGINVEQSQSQNLNFSSSNIINYTPEIYKASPINRAIIKGQNGLMYIANDDGILEFDGVSWRLFRLPNKTKVRALAIDDKGIIYYGGQGDFGYLSITKNGNYKLVSLLNKLKLNDKNLKEVWNIFCLNNKVIFQSTNKLMVLTGDTITTIQNENDFYFSFLSNGFLYLREINIGLKKLVGAKLELCKGGEYFSNKIISNILPYDIKENLIVSQKDGLFLYSDNKITSLKSPIDLWMKNNQIISSLHLKNGNYVFGSSQNGIVITNRYFLPIRFINKVNGLRNNNILSLFEDNNNLWVCTENGINYINLNSNIIELDEKSGIEGGGYAAQRYENKLYLGTSQGLFYKDLTSNNDEFKLIDGTKGQVWNLQVFDNTLFMGHNDGLFEVKGTKVKQISSIIGAWILVQPNPNSSLLIVGSYKGIYTIEKEKQSWKLKTHLNGFDESSRIMVMQENDLWVSHPYKGIYKLELSKSYDSILKITHFSNQNGLPSSISNYVFNIKNKILFAGEYGLFNFNKEKGSFKINHDFDAFFKFKEQIHHLKEDNYGNIWFSKGNEIGQLKKMNNDKFNCINYYSLNGRLNRDFELFQSIDSNKVIIGTEKGFVLINTLKTKCNSHINSVLIRNITCLTNDSILFYGVKQNNSNKLELPFVMNNLRFNFALNSFENPSKNRYSYYLKGNDNHWSEWQFNTYKEYTNLQEGNYVFYVKAIDLDNNESTIASYAFSICPPWYRSIPMRIAYIFILLFLVFYIRKRIIIRIERSKQKLKQIHKEEQDRKEQEIILLKYQKVEIELELKNEEMSKKHSELASITMQNMQKNEALQKIKNKLESMTSTVEKEVRMNLNDVINLINEDLELNNNWEQFEIHFDMVHGNFLQRLRDNYPELSAANLKLAAYLRMNLSSKEIAPLMNITLRGVEQSRLRLRQKLNLDQEIRLLDFIMQI